MRLRIGIHAWLAKQTHSITVWVALLGLLGGLPLVLLTPPFQVADEPQHFERAYQISRLDLFAYAHDHAAGAMLPASISEMVRDDLGTTAIDAPRPVTARPLTTSLAGLHRPLVPEHAVFTEFTGAAPYSPLPYIPQAIAIALGRSFGMGPLALLYCARLANIVAAILLLIVSVRTAPVAREALAVAGLMPMALLQYASASPDAMTIASALLFTAMMMRAVVRGLTCRDAVAAAALGAVFCSHKLVYAPLLLAGLIPAFFLKNRVRTVVLNGLIALVAIGTALCWLAANSSLMLTRAPGTDVHAQAAFILAHPMAFASILSTTLTDHALDYVIGLVGVGGWSTIPLPPIGYALALCAIILALFIRHAAEPAMPRLAGAWHLLLVAGSAALVEIALYVTWNPVGAGTIEGVQGRYFLPMLGLFLIALHTLLRVPQDEGRSRKLRTVVLTFAAVQILILDASIAAAFSIF